MDRSAGNRGDNKVPSYQSTKSQFTDYRFVFKSRSSVFIWRMPRRVQAGSRSAVGDGDAFGDHPRAVGGDGVAGIVQFGHDRDGAGESRVIAQRDHAERGAGDHILHAVHAPRAARP